LDAASLELQVFSHSWLIGHVLNLVIVYVAGWLSYILTNFSALRV